MRIAALFVTVVSGALAVGCSSDTMPRSGAVPRPARWTALEHVAGVVDLSGPRPDGALTIAAHGRLLSGRPLAPALPFAPRYSAPAGLEPYITLATAGLSGARCRFPAGTVYALRLRDGHGVTAVSRHGRVRRFARLPSAGLENGIAFDTTGRFGHRLLVTDTANGVTTVYAIDCQGRVETLTRSAPRVEGGIVVAPRGFGRFGGDLIAPDERSGKLYAIAPSGASSVLLSSRLPSGPDTGVESLGFVPARFGEALVADRLTPGNPHPGDNAILALLRSALTARHVRPGELLAVTEAGARTIAVSCGTSCTAQLVAVGPPRAHIEGHVIFTRP
jgi:hypothetical protein